MASVNGSQSKLRLIGQDLRRVVRATETFFRYLRAKEDIELSLGLFAAAAHSAIPGQLNQYRVRIANAGHDHRDVTLGIDICAVNAPRHSDGHYGSFSKYLGIAPRTASTITIQFDWLTEVRLLIDGISARPDSLWRGDVSLPQLYSVSAALFDTQGNLLNMLTIYQELTG